MRCIMRHGKDHGLLPIARCFHVNPRSLPHRRSAPIGGDHQPCADLRPVAQRHDGPVVTGQHPGKAGAGAKIDIGQFRQPRQQLAAQQPVGQVPAKGRIPDLGGVEIRRHRRLGPGIDDAHHLQRRGMRRQTRPKPGLIQQVARRLQKRGGAQIGARVGGRGYRRGRIDADHVKPRRTEHRRCTQPGHAATGNQDIGLSVFHANDIGGGQGAEKPPQPNCDKKAARSLVW